MSLKQTTMIVAGVAGLLGTSAVAEGQDGSLFPDYTEHQYRSDEVERPTAEQESESPVFRGYIEGTLSGESEDGFDIGYVSEAGRVTCDVGDLRLHFGESFARGVDHTDEGDMDRGLVNVGGGLGYLSRGENADVYVEAGLYLDQAWFDGLIDLDGENLQLGGRLNFETDQLWAGNMTKLFAQFALGLSGGYEGQISGIDVRDDYSRSYFRLGLRQNLGGPFAARFDLRYDTANFEDLVETGVWDLRLGLNIGLGKDWSVEPYVGFLQERAEYPRTGQEVNPASWYGGAALTWYPVEGVGVQADLRFTDGDHGYFVPRIGVVMTFGSLVNANTEE